MKTNPNELIQPVIYSEQNGYCGLTKREYFAALALQGMLAGMNELTTTKDPIENWAVDMADRLIEKLNKPLTEDEKPE